MASTTAESKHEMDREEKNGVVLAGLPFEVKRGFGSNRYLEYDYQGRPMVVYDHLPIFSAITRLMEQYRDLERSMTRIIKEKDEAIARAEAVGVQLESSERQARKQETERKRKNANEAG